MYKLTDETKKELTVLQNSIDQNYGKAELGKAINWMGEEMEELKEGIAKNDVENIKEELAQVFIWCISLSNIFGFKLDEIAEREINHHLQKYPKNLA